MIRKIVNFVIVLISLFFLVSCCAKDSGTITAESAIGNVNSSYITISNINAIDSLITLNINAKTGKYLKIQPYINGIYAQPTKYRVIYRIDNRVTKPLMLIAIQEPNKLTTGKYTPDWVSVTDLAKYAAFTTRQSISLKQGDAVNMRILSKAEFFDNYLSSDYNMQYVSSTSTTNSIITYSNLDNAIIYMSSNLCTLSSILSNSSCNNNNLKLNSTTINKIKYGYADAGFSSLNTCSANNSDNSLCLYKDGAGVAIQVGGQSVKGLTDTFIADPNNNNKKMLFFIAPEDGNLTFTTTKSVGGTFVTSSSKVLKYLHLGEYFFEIDVGSSTGTALNDKITNMSAKFGFVTSQNGVNFCDTTNGGVLDLNSLYNGNSPGSGEVCVTVDVPSGIGGQISFASQSYTDSDKFSTFIQNILIDPLTSSLQTMSLNMVSSLINNEKFRAIVNIAMTLYIVLYATYFLAGAVEIKTQDLMYRLIQIVGVSTALNPSSWSMSSEYLIGFFDIMDYMIRSVSVVGSSANLFAFIDPILEKYFSGSLWTIIIVYLFRIDLGYTVIAVFMMMGIFDYVKSLFSVIFSYLISYLSLAVIISLTPFFLLCTLFSKTRRMFDNWLSLIFSYTFQPTILLIFVMMVNQAADGLLTAIITDCVCKKFLEIGIDMKIFNIHLFNIYAYEPSGGSSSFMTNIGISFAFFMLNSTGPKLNAFISNLSETLFGAVSSGTGAASAGASVNSAATAVYSMAENAASQSIASSVEAKMSVDVNKYTRTLENIRNIEAAGGALEKYIEKHNLSDKETKDLHKMNEAGRMLGKLSDKMQNKENFKDVQKYYEKHKELFDELSQISKKENMLKVLANPEVTGEVRQQYETDLRKQYSKSFSGDALEKQVETSMKKYDNVANKFHEALEIKDDHEREAAISNLFAKNSNFATNLEHSMNHYLNDHPNALKANLSK